MPARQLLLGLLIFTLVSCAPASAQVATLTAADFINGIPQASGLSGAEDLTDELTDIASTIVADGKHYPAGAYLVGQYATILTTFGRNIAVMAQTLEFLPPTQKTQLSAYLRNEVTLLLTDTTYATEETGSLGYRTGVNQYNIYGPIVCRPGADAFEDRYTGSDYRDPFRNVLTQLPGNQSSGLRTGAYMGAYSAEGHTISRWEGLYGLWAYAHYTGDWQFIQTNWTQIKNLRAQAPADPMKNDYPYQGGFLAVDGTNSWLIGLISYGRMAAHLNDTATLNSTLTQLNSVITKRVNLGLGGTLITYGWNDTSYHVSTDWRGVQSWWEFTPELGRLLKDRFAYTSSGAGMFSSSRDRYFYLADNAHEGTGENQGEHPWVSYQIYQGELYARAKPADAVNGTGAFTYLQADRDYLRNYLPVSISTRAMPWHMDMYRLQNLLGLIRSHGTITWVNP